jgi:hypothetical protein
MMLKTEVTKELATIFPECDLPITVAVNVGFRVFHGSGFEKFHLLRYVLRCVLPSALMLAFHLAYSSTLKTKATCSFIMSVDFQWTTWCYILEDRTLSSSVQCSVRRK